MRQTISASRKPVKTAWKAETDEITSVMPLPVPPSKTAMVKPDPEDTKLDVDERERLLKAERRRDKNARKRARELALKAIGNE